MAERGFQLAFARLLVDADLRRTFLAGDESRLADLGLDTATRQRLASLRGPARGGFEFFGDLLDAKRARRARGLTPVLLRLIGEERWDRCWRSRRSVIPKSESPASAMAEAIAFVREAPALLRDEPVSRELAADVCRVELARLLVDEAHARHAEQAAPAPMIGEPEGTSYPAIIHPTVICGVHHDLTSLLRSDPSEIANLCPPADVVYVTYRDDRANATRVARMGPTHARLLRHCDGRTAREALAWKVFGAQADSARVRAAVSRAVVALESSGILLSSPRPVSCAASLRELEEPP